MEQASAISFSAAFLAGILTFLSPCILPLIPAYISYITGISLDQLKKGESRSIRRKTLVHSLLFIAGFSLVFIALGASATYVGRLFAEYKSIISRIGGAFIIVLGLYLVGVFKLDFLAKEKRLTLKLQKGSKVSSVLFGVVFAAAWTPCVGPILGSILTLAGTRSSMIEGTLLLCAYSLGIAIPFIVSALLINSFLAYFARLKKYISAVQVACGVLLIIIGLLLLFQFNMV